MLVNKIIDTYTIALKIPEKVVDESNNILKRYLDKRTLHGRSIEVYAAAFILLGCKKRGYPLTTTRMNDILEFDNDDKHAIARAARYIAREIGESFLNVKLEKYVDIIQSEVGSSIQCRSYADRIMRYISEKGISLGDNNPAIAVAISYVADRIGRYYIVERDYCKAVGTSEITLRNYKRKILDNIPEIRRSGTRYEWVGIVSDTVSQ